MYDWANSAYATTVMAGFFPIFFKQYWSAGVDVHVSTFNLGTANSLAGITVALLAPVLGSIGDEWGKRKKFLLFFAAMGVVMTGTLGFVARGNWVIAMLLYIFATIGFTGGNVFYDSLLLAVVGRKKMDFVSALGYSLGYLGGGILFALNVLMILNPHLFGLDSVAEAVRLSFITVAAWWAMFSIPLLAFVKEPKVKKEQPALETVVAGLKQLCSTFRKIRQLRHIFLFLIGYWCYIDGVDTVVLMAVDYGLSLGFDQTVLIKALLVTQLIGFPSAIAFGKIGEKLGTKTGIFIGIGVYVLVTLWGAVMKAEIEFYALAIAVGLVQGGVQSLSRSFFGKMIPRESAAEFFGFYNMLGKFAAVIGPLLMGWTSMATGNARSSILVMIVLFLVGGTILYFVREPSTDNKN
ncbi:MAG: MFS transporter [Syntrophorhabdus aromaticivorans]|uniref:MFS transporter n=2 Tax=Syntrophorhabdus aromaticivorans TaxID=328301 RepID=A0A351U6X7_9BACT|nr:MFS transporter [Syntrophorhabdus aromaticivorans]NLW34015.1 MFS transporter [Syntrophorhabdus aromaticivorans]HBA55708.1 MFS transporter [Syntrophorhabdus aromaticivorans]